jgi:hypothetical protein
MPRYFDLLMSKQNKLWPPSWNIPYMDQQTLLQYEQHWRGVIRAARPFIFEATNVCEYFYNGTDQEFWKPDEDFPCLAPPALITWIEYGRPSGAKTNVADRVGHFDSDNLPRKTGILIMALERGMDYFKENNDRFRDRESWWQGCKRPVRDIDSARMCLVCYAFMGMDDEIQTIGPIGEYILWLDDNFDCFEYMMYVPMVVEEAKKDLSFKEGDMIGIDNLVFPAMLTLTMLNLKNVSTKTVRPDEGLKPKHVQHYVEQHGQSRVMYKTLEITPYQSIRSLMPGGTSIGRKVREHIYRGHVIRSGVDGRKHLFGNPKVVGRFWVQPGSRGSKKVGEVQKDYKVKAPRKEIPE